MIATHQRVLLYDPSVESHRVTWSYSFIDENLQSNHVTVLIEFLINEFNSINIYENTLAD